jgi:hypothetical protein
MQKLKNLIDGAGVHLMCSLILMGFLFLWAGDGQTGVSDSSGKSGEGVKEQNTGDLAMEEAALQTMEALYKLKMSESQIGTAKELVKNLTYTHMRVVRAISALPSMTGEGMLDALRQLPRIQITFDHLLVLEHFVTLPDVHIEVVWKFLKKLEGLNFVAGRVAKAIGLANNLHPSVMLGLIDRLATLNEPELWAFKAFLEVPGQTAATVEKGLRLIDTMTEKQCWAAEKCSKIAGMTPDSALLNMNHIQRLSATDASNARALFEISGMTPEASLSWIIRYFSVSQDAQESVFFASNVKDKTILLKALAEAADFLIWKMNNLHDITHPDGREVGIKVLSSCPASQLYEIYHRLDSKVQARFNSEFSAGMAKSRGAAIGALRRATSAARVQAARDLTTANAYVLLSRGSDFYDSSFREILVPVFKERVDARFSGNLLKVLKTIDPDNAHVSDFIISLAQKGKLTVFFPSSVREQEQVLDLVAVSAFQDENSLILFSATFMTLLETLQPESRSYLIAKMLTAIRDKNTVFSTQLRVILQYYIKEYPKLVSSGDKAKIQEMLSEYGTIPLEQYVKTSFAEWKSDGKLSSLSIFQSDDDGTQSFHSNCQTLMAHGYRPRVSSSYVLTSSNNSHDRAAMGQLKGLLGSPSQNMGQIHQIQLKHPLVVDWVKVINGIEVSHSVVVYFNAGRQQELVRQFLAGGHEMFVQRGHSYWRKEQLLDPLEELKKSGAITDADLTRKQRFISLGSCGGIRAYSEIALFFHNRVDILATVGVGKAVVNDPYNHILLEMVAARPNSMSWEEVRAQAALIFKQGMGEEYLQPGSLPAILHKIMDQKQIEKQHGKSVDTQSAQLDARPNIQQSVQQSRLEIRQSVE